MIITVDQLISPRGKYQSRKDGFSECHFDLRTRRLVEQPSDASRVVAWLVAALVLLIALVAGGKLGLIVGVGGGFALAVWLARQVRSVVTYDVMISSTGTSYALGWLGPIMVPGLTAGTWIELSVEYRAWVDPDHVAKLLDACVGRKLTARSPHPGHALVVRMRRLAFSIAKDDPAAFDGRGRGAIEVLERTMEKILLAELGLTAIIQLRTAATLPTIETAVTVHTADHTLPIPLLVVVDTALATRERPLHTLALRRHSYSFLQEVVERTTRDVVHGLTTAQLRHDLNGAPTRKLQAELEVAFESCYIRPHAVYLTLLERLDAPLARHQQLLIVAVPLREHDDPVLVTLHLHLELLDERRYRSAQAPDLPAWIDQHARHIVTRELHGITHLQLCFEPELWEPTVITALQAAALEIGYQLTAKLVYRGQDRSDLGIAPRALLNRQPARLLAAPGEPAARAPAGSAS